MDALTIPRLRARLHGPALARRLAIEAQRGGEEGRAAAERLGRTERSRPRGTLLWVHAPDGIDPAALLSLRDRLDDDLDGPAILLTAESAPALPAGTPADAILHQHPPIDTRRPVDRFLDHWMPDAAIWIGSVDQPLLLDACARRAIPLFLQNAVAPTPEGTRARNLQRRLLGLFDRIFATDSGQAEAIRSLGAIPARIEVTGPLTRIHSPPPCVEYEREALVSALQTRPVWLAACPAAPEIDAVLRAHAQALRSAHRLLLILVPVADHLGPELARNLTGLGWNVARRDAGEDPQGTTDVFIVDLREELGLCYRLAPVTFLGGTLLGADVPDALDPATLGSAIIAGPQGGSQAETLARLESAGACYRIANPDTLGQAVVELLSPETAASLALGAWDVASEGVQVVERLATQLSSAIRNRAS
ncbi:3-deoxy-D-manno-octulosonic acid transferase [Tropicimonas aquimaris]|uniref:3-deoxy-D-manno-octulosonic acid transferase n=1 Tax=Tropicimonas aquimaris TaxID=914152 RepID=A0ABW3IV83_9RHOB